LGAIGVLTAHSVEVICPSCGKFLTAMGCSFSRRHVGRAFLLENKTKKADVAEHPEVFDHVGLLVNEPSSYAGVPFI
jgi:hypothetical protein